VVNAGLRFFIHRAGGRKRNSQIRGIASDLMMIARIWVRSPEPDIAKLKLMVEKTRPKHEGLPESAHRSLAPFRDRENVRRFLGLPDTIVKDAERDRLDETVVGEIAKRVLEPDRLAEMLQAYVRAGSERERLAKLRHGHKEVEAAIARLLELVEHGLVGAEDPTLRERLIGLKLQRDESTKDASDLHRHIASGAPQITPNKIGKLAVLLREKLRYGPPELRQADARLVMDDVSVTNEVSAISAFETARGFHLGRISGSS
jgi:hypothetical protein